MTKYLRLVFRNALRNRWRSSLTALAITVSVFLLAFFKTAIEALEQESADPEILSRVWVMNSTSLANVLPLRYLREIEAIPGVRIAAPMSWFGGKCEKDDDYFFANFAVDADKIFDIYGEWETSEEEKRAFAADKAGAVVGLDTAERLSLSIGDKVTLVSPIYGLSLELNVRGIYRRKEGSGADQATILFHHEYLNESLPESLENRDICGTFAAKTTSPDLVPDVIDRIDANFANSTFETKTMSDRAFVREFVGMLGNVKLLIASIAAVIVFSIFLVAANTMAMSARERSPEVAILKTLGFSPARILFLFLGEAVLISLAGGLAGSLAAKAAFVLWRFDVMGFFPDFDVSVETMILALVLSVILGLVSGGIPAFRSARLAIADGLGRAN